MLIVLRKELCNGENGEKWKEAQVTVAAYTYLLKFLLVYFGDN